MAEDITELLHAWQAGDREALAMPVVRDALRRAAALRLGGGQDAPSSPTGLVHEVLSRMLGGSADLASRAHFLALAALHMRTILVERARLAATREPTAPRAGATGAPGEPAIGEHAFDVLMLERALQQLEQHDERAARVVVMSCFGGMQRDEIAVAASIPAAAVDGDLRFARAWLNRALA